MDYQDFILLQVGDWIREEETGKIGKIIFLDCGGSLEESEIHVMDEFGSHEFSIFPDDFEVISFSECLCPCRCGCLPPELNEKGLCGHCLEGKHEVPPAGVTCGVDETIPLLETMLAQYKKIQKSRKEKK